MKKVLILTTSYGQGHIATAKAIEEGLQRQSKTPIDIEIVDFTETISSLLNKTSKKMYEDTSKYAPLLYKFFFDSTDFPLPFIALNSINYYLSREKILNLFHSKDPDLIICNSPHWQYIASLAREKDFQNVPLVSVITDSITIHASWTIGDSDYYIAPNQETSHSLQILGVQKDRVKVLGYPISLSFTDKSFHKSNFLQSVGLSSGKKIILSLVTGMRYSSASKTLKQLQQTLPDTQIVAITGRDEPLYNKLKTNFGPTIKLIGWTEKMPQFILASDLVITKAGGSTVMECLGAIKPVIICKIIPGQEEGNAEYITKHHLGIVALEPEMIAHAAHKILDNMPSYCKSLNKVAIPQASLSIASFLLDLIENNQS